MATTAALTGTAIVGQALVSSLGAQPPERIRVHGQCWELVTDPAIIQAAQDAKDYADQQDQTVLDQAASLAQDKADAAQAEAIRLADLAATEADEALEAALGEAVADKSNVFIQPVAPVEEMQRAGVLWIDTTPVTIDGAQVPGNIPKTWDGTDWVEITDSATVQAASEAAAAHAAAEAAATAAGEAMAEARYAPRIADRPPTQADGIDKPIGAGWLEYEQTTNYQGITADRLIQQWMWTGTVWVRLDMDPQIIPVIQIGTGTFGDLTGDRITVTGTLAAALAEIIELSVDHLVVTGDATINEAVAIAISGATLNFQEAYLHNLRVDGTATIDEAVIGELATNIITSGLFRTAESGQRVVIDSNGIVMWGSDSDGVDYELVRIGPSGENIITVGDSTIAPTGVAATSGDFESLTIGGDTVADLLTTYPRGVIAIAFSGTRSAWNGTNDDIRRLEVYATLEPDRRYRVTVDQHYVQLKTANAMTYVETLRRGAPGSVTIIGIARHQLAASDVEQTVGAITAYVDTRGASGPVDEVFGFAMRGPAGRDVRIYGTAASGLRLTVEDVGPSLYMNGSSYMDQGSAVETTTQDAPPPVVTIKRYTKVISSTGYRCYDYDGSTAGTPDVVQGVYAGGPQRLVRRGGWTFPSLTGALAGATIEKVRVKLYVNHTYYNSGATVNICSWGSTMADNLTSRKAVSGWKKNTSKWVTLPSSVHAGLKSGSIAGVGVKPTTTSATQYARLATSAKLEITYTKAV